MLLANGRTPQAIAAEQQLTPAAIRKHASNAYQKLGVHSLRDAVDAALKTRIIVPGDIVTGPFADRLRVAELERANRDLRERLRVAEERLTAAAIVGGRAA
jgi:hypothetical protein